MRMYEWLVTQSIRIFRTLRQTDFIALGKHYCVLFQLLCRSRVIRLELFSPDVALDGAVGDTPFET